MDDRFTRMISATAALAAVVGVLAGPAGAYNAQRPVAAQSEALQAQSAAAVVVPYLSHGVGVDKTQFSGQAWLSLAAQTIPYLSQGVGVDKSQFTGQATPRLTGVHAALLDRHSPPSEPQSLGLTGDGALTRVPAAAPAPTVSGGNDIDWTSFGAGAGIVALVAAGLVGILLTARRRHTIGLP
jgi:hypothetical protein